jgi:AraC family transcriptional regulator of adaptative response/methylated-DNA-[protein]-cysteine methyltransferase
MFVCATENGVCLLEFVDRRALETEFSDIQRLFSARIIAGENEYTRQAVKEIGEYFAGERQRFTLTLDAPGTAFQQQVWQALREVGYAGVSHYGRIAEQTGNPKAVRAVASATGANRIAIVIPCHRILGKDGAMTGYGGGIARKKWLLEHEAKYQHSAE